MKKCWQTALMNLETKLDFNVMIARQRVYGSDVRIFESMLSSYFDNAYVKTVASGTSGILGAFYALGIKESEVICPPFTWPGALAPLHLLGNKIIFSGIEEPTLTMNPDTLEKLITPNTKAIFSADFGGYPGRLDDIAKICKKYNLILIHDAASSMGSTYKNKYSGYFADISIFSFGRNKPFTTGEGGVIVTRKESLYKKIIFHTAHPDRQIIELGKYNPVAINTELNPLGIKYGIETFRKQIKAIKDKQNMLQEILAGTLPQYIRPNMYMVFLKKDNPVIKRYKTIELYDFKRNFILDGKIKNVVKKYIVKRSF